MTANNLNDSNNTTPPVNPNSRPPKQNNAFMELIFNIIVPSVILMKLSGDEYLGTVAALVIALAFPIGYGIYDFYKNKSLNFFSLLGFISTLLTGGIGLFELDPEWLAIKEAAIPAAIGIVVFISGFVGRPLLAKLLLNPAIFNLDLIYDCLAAEQQTENFRRKISRANHWLSVTFVFSSLANYFLAKWVVTSPAGTAAFNEELGEMTMLSYPVIAIPSMIMLMAILYYVVKTITSMTHLTFEQVLHSDNKRQ